MSASEQALQVMQKMCSHKRHYCSDCLAWHMIQILVLFAVVPLLRRRFSWHETSMSMLVCLCMVSGLLGAAAASVLWPNFAVALCVAGGAQQV